MEVLFFLETETPNSPRMNTKRKTGAITTTTEDVAAKRRKREPPPPPPAPLTAASNSEKRANGGGGSVKRCKLSAFAVLPMEIIIVIVKWLLELEHEVLMGAKTRSWFLNYSGIWEKHIKTKPECGLFEGSLVDDIPRHNFLKIFMGTYRFRRDDGVYLLHEGKYRKLIEALEVGKKAVLLVCQRREFWEKAMVEKKVETPRYRRPKEGTLLSLKVGSIESIDEMDEWYSSVTLGVPGVGACPVLSSSSSSSGDYEPSSSWSVEEGDGSNRIPPAAGKVWDSPLPVSLTQFLYWCGHTRKYAGQTIEVNSNSFAGHYYHAEEEFERYTTKGGKKGWPEGYPFSAGINSKGYLYVGSFQTWGSHFYCLIREAWQDLGPMEFLDKIRREIVFVHSVEGDQTPPADTFFRDCLVREMENLFQREPTFLYDWGDDRPIPLVEDWEYEHDYKLSHTSHTDLKHRECEWVPRVTQVVYSLVPKTDDNYKSVTRITN